ncbi:hypothetical protein I204_02655 [Kwoniella mangroviensis CBS 8886]|uniref:hypothetical protein n=1 Tax=Kwoniella mangroviensis CBS 8507 TaxID=1296122 RepID=UPI00080D461F|nr:uncharacterized protein I203_01977 [Kwoniella mangroviensis CBS 8507]OCF68594.1 hypothetical protein I203_01977 [Kwoniella mangroviensis CBS 8507]OCF76946.1 hypothetical protein I204_02655 [Kwoniella mangroviensis CBS 8886]
MSSLNPLPHLGPHLPPFLLSTLFFYGIQYTSHKISPRLIAKYGEFDKRTRTGWATHVVSMVHAILVIPLAFQCLSSPSLKSDPVFGYDHFVGHVFAFSSGYFLWDTLDSLMNSTIGFVVHGAACLAVFMFSFRPFLAGFGAPFLLWELSTPLLNIHWFMDKSGLSARYPTFFLANALIFMLVFFLARIVYGGANSLLFFRTMWDERDRIPLHLHVIYCSGNLALNALNWLWFSKMLGKMYARIQGDEKVKSPKAGKGEKEPLLRDDAKDGENPAQSKEEEEEEEEGSLTLPANPPSPIVEKGDRDVL